MLFILKIQRKRNINNAGCILTGERDGKTSGKYLENLSKKPEALGLEDECLGKWYCEEHVK